MKPYDLPHLNTISITFSILTPPTLIIWSTLGAPAALSLCHTRHTHSMLNLPYDNSVLSPARREGSSLGHFSPVPSSWRKHSRIALSMTQTMHGMSNSLCSPRSTEKRALLIRIMLAPFASTSLTFLPKTSSLVHADTRYDY